MKKIIITVLAGLLVCSMAACGGSKGAEKSQSSAAETDSEHEYKLENEASGSGFACLILDNDECYWAVGLTKPADVEAYFSIKEAPRTYIEILPENADVESAVDEADSQWQMYVVGDEVPDWFEEDYDEYSPIVWDAFDEWRETYHTAEPVKAAENGTILIPEATGEGFACAVRKDGKVFWEMGVNSPEEIVKKNELSDVTHLIAQIVYVGDGDPETDEYNENDWQIQIIGDEIPTWFTSVERTEFNMRDALEDWIEQGGLEQ